MDEQKQEELKTCQYCKHFLRHYTKFRYKQFFPLDVGHCINPRLRDKRIDTPACHRFVKAAKPK